MNLQVKFVYLMESYGFYVSFIIYLMIGFMVFDILHPTNTALRPKLSYLSSTIIIIGLDLAFNSPNNLCFRLFYWPFRIENIGCIDSQYFVNVIRFENFFNEQLILTKHHAPLELLLWIYFRKGLK